MSRPTLPWLAVLLFAAGCQTTELSTVWKTSDPLPPPFQKIATIVVNATPAERRAGEDELVRMLKPGLGVPSYKLIADEHLRNRDKVREILHANGVDGVIVLRLVTADKTITYYPPTYRTHYRYFDYYEAYLTASPGYTTTDTTIHTEVSIYSVSEEKLLWAGAGSTTNPASIRDLCQQVAKATAKELREQGMLK